MKLCWGECTTWRKFLKHFFVLSGSLCFGWCDAANVFYLEQKIGRINEHIALCCIVFSPNGALDPTQFHLFLCQPHTIMYLTVSLSSLSLKAQCCSEPFQPLHWILSSSLYNTTSKILKYPFKIYTNWAFPPSAVCTVQSVGWINALILLALNSQQNIYLVDWVCVAPLYLYSYKKIKPTGHYRLTTLDYLSHFLTSEMPTRLVWAGITPLEKGIRPLCHGLGLEPRSKIQDCFTLKIIVQL